mgnify:CR=1 FL=1
MRIADRFLCGLTSLVLWLPAVSSGWISAGFFPSVSLRAEQTFRTEAYQIHTSCNLESLQYQASVCRVLILQVERVDGVG